jgi:hypothetical protein
MPQMTHFRNSSSLSCKTLSKASKIHWISVSAQKLKNMAKICPLVAISLIRIISTSRSLRVFDDIVCFLRAGEKWLKAAFQAHGG